MSAWRTFVAANAHRGTVSMLAAVVRQPVSRVDHVVTRIRAGAGSKKRAATFPELFAEFHGREPEEQEWPAPRKFAWGYEWLAPELELLATLVGQLSGRDIASVLTQRLREVTGDSQAARGIVAVQGAAQRLGLQLGEALGGIACSAAALEIGSYNVVYHAIEARLLQAHKVGRIIVIDRASWKRFLASRDVIPDGYVRLSSIRTALGISSDAKLPEFASLGYIPTAVQIAPNGALGAGGGRIWYISQEVADRLVADRRRGSPMPWHGKPLAINLKCSYRRWRERRHPASCKTCREIWGGGGAPGSQQAFDQVYPGLTRKQKRHLTQQWCPGLTVDEAADLTGQSAVTLRAAVKSGELKYKRASNVLYFTEAAVLRWAKNQSARSGKDRFVRQDWIAARYGFTAREINALCVEGTLRRRGKAISEADCITYRLSHGIGVRSAAKHLGVSVPRLKRMIEDLCGTCDDIVGWNRFRHIQSLVSRVQSISIEAAAQQLGKDVEWVKAHIDAGTVVPTTSKWARSERMLSKASVRKLRGLRRRKLPVPPAAVPANADEWMTTPQAAKFAGVSTTLILRWRQEGGIPERLERTTVLLERKALRRRAARYWRHERTRNYSRRPPPAWLKVRA